MKLIFSILFLSLTTAGFAKQEIAYGPDKAQRLDLYLPTAPTNAPVMIFIHGGAWAIGDKRATGKKPAFFNSRGWIFISTNYRLLPRGKHPNNVEDVARAIAWTHSNISKYGGNPESIFIMGHSAGAHLAALVATAPQPLKKWGKELSVIKGVVSLDTQAYDLNALLKDGAPRLYRNAFSTDPAVWRAASPITHVTKGQNIPPFLICYSRGMGRRVNPERARQAAAFGRALQDSGIQADVVNASDRSHKEINQWFGRPDDKKVTQRAEQFLNAILNGSCTKRTTTESLPAGGTSLSPPATEQPAD